MAENIPVRPKRSRMTPPPPPLREVVTPDPPDHLSDEAKRMWTEISEEWVLGLDATPLLQAALESWDAYRSARVQLTREGATVSNPETGFLRQHPAHKVAMDNLREFRMAFRQLGLQPPE